MRFPKPPFRLTGDKDKADDVLIKYLKRTSFAYLSSATINVVKRLGNAPLRDQLPLLLDLWPKVLIDALKHLKMNDAREWDQNQKKINFRSFFHARSLGVDDLTRLVKKFTEFEGLLYGASPEKYRDHIAHAFRVWVTGHAILVQKTCFAGSLFAEMFADNISSEEWQCMWAITALCHDLGYPVSHIDKINARARDALQGMGLVSGGDLRFGFSQQMLPFHDTVIKMMASRPAELPAAPERDRQYTTHLQNKYYLKLLKSFDDLEHGVISALLVSKALVYFLESDFVHDGGATLSADDARQFLIRREILRAIAAHTCQDIYHLRFNTLAFLLYVVDEIQCWGRPTLETLTHDVAGVSEGEAEVLAFNARKVDIVIRTKEQKWSPDVSERAKKQLNKLHRMLRLAVDTSKLEDHDLRFTVAPQSGNGWRLSLESGKIALKKVDALSVGR